MVEVRIRVGGFGGTVYTPIQAQAANVISKQIWIWNGAAGSVELLIPAEVSPLSRLDADPARTLAGAPLPWYLGWLDWVVPPARAADSEWPVRLTVTNKVTSWQDSTNLLGQKFSAQTGYDAHDLSEMAPFATPYLTLGFPHPEWPNSPDGQNRAGDYATDFRPAQGNPPTTWTLKEYTEVEGAIADERCTTTPA